MKPGRGRVCGDALDEVDAASLVKSPTCARATCSWTASTTPRMRMAERVDADAADEVEERVAVHVGDGAALRVVDGDACHHRIALEARARCARLRARGARGSSVPGTGV